MAIPKQIKHCTMEVFNKINPPPMDGDFELSKFVNAYNICTGKAQQNGYVYLVSGGDKENSVQLTQKGMEKEQEHLADTTMRSATFDKFWDRYNSYL